MVSMATTIPYAVNYWLVVYGREGEDKQGV